MKLYTVGYEGLDINEFPSGSVVTRARQKKKNNLSQQVRENAYEDCINSVS
ncbi:MAG: hypothetical protein H7061_13000 [Bdellovibrionaceae bacterium]|nr:hypothetical protein [Bdellovibrio sp.]